MNISTRSRSELKNYFKKNSMPTERNFSELVDGMLNLKDDGLHKLPQNPLRLEASNSGQQKALELYKSFGDEAATWSLSLNPRIDPANEASQTRKGLSIEGRDGKSRLFIDENTGHLGIGTLEPTSTLHINGGVKIDQTLTVKLIAQEQWLDLQLLNGLVPARKNYHQWTRTNTNRDVNIPRYFKDSFGFVHLSGKISHSNHSNSLYGYGLAQLPEGYRPCGDVVLIAASYSSTNGTDESSNIIVFESGELRLSTNQPLYWVSLDGLSFKVD